MESSGSFYSPIAICLSLIPLFLVVKVQ
jgi:hypothetical protein